MASTLHSRLAELLDEFELRSISATESTGPDTWCTTTVREAGLWDEINGTHDNGLVTIVEDGGL